MRKLLLVGALVLITASVFAQTAPTTNYEIYGATFFDYQMSGTELALATPLFSNFTFSKLRIGLRAQLADGVKSYFELDPRNGEFRLAYIDWVPMANLAITLGKTFTNFEQIISPYGAARQYLAGVKYAMPGIGWAGLQVGNKSDITFISGSYLIFPTPSFNPATPTSPAQPDQVEVWSYKQDPNLYLFPAIVFKPDLGKDLSLEAGVESQMIVQKMILASPTGLSLDGYFTVAGFGFAFTNEFAWMNLNDAAAANQEYTYYAQLTYKIGMFAPTVYFVTDAKTSLSTNPNTAIGIELPIQVGANLKINPLFSYAIAGYDPFEGNNALVDHLYNQNDWTFGIRFDYSYSIKF